MLVPVAPGNHPVLHPCISPFILFQQTTLTDPYASCTIPCNVISCGFFRDAKEQNVRLSLHNIPEAVHPEGERYQEQNLRDTLK